MDNWSTTLLWTHHLQMFSLLSGLPSSLGDREVTSAVNHSCLILSPELNGSSASGLGSWKLWHLHSPARFKLQGQLHRNCWFIGTPHAATKWAVVYERFGHWVRFSSGLSAPDSLYYDCVDLVFLLRYTGSKSAIMQKRLLASHWPWTSTGFPLWV